MNTDASPSTVDLSDGEAIDADPESTAGVDWEGREGEGEGTPLKRAIWSRPKERCLRISRVVTALHAFCTSEEVIYHEHVYISNRASHPLENGGMKALHRRDSGQGK